jgi:hypothetical protein
MPVPLQSFVGLTLAELTALRASYVEAQTAVAQGQSYTIAGRSLTRANLGDIAEALAAISYAINQLTARNRRQTGNATYFRLA